MNNMRKFKIRAIINFVYIMLLLISYFTMGCKKLVEIDSPTTSTNSDIVYVLDATATAVLTNVYSNLSAAGPLSKGGLPSLSLFTSLSSDELTVFSGVSDLDYLTYYQNNLSSNSSNYWGRTYSIIYIANAALEGLSASNTLTPAVKRQLLGEAKFIRAFCYFYLVNLYGDVPLNLTTDYKANSVRPRTEQSKVYEQIISDLKDAQSLLNVDYVDATNSTTPDRTRPNKFAATALLARTYLFTKDYVNAEIQATSVISKNDTYDTVALNNVFLRDSKEVIWSLQSISRSLTNTSEALTFILSPNGPNNNTIYGSPVYLSRRLKNTFEILDKRKTFWVDSVTVSDITYSYSIKYKNNIPSSAVTERAVILRLAEQYLIRAEARAWQGKIHGMSGAEADLNVIRKRAGLRPTTATIQTEMLAAILHERNVEFFTEWGHRWFDLKRTGNADKVLQGIKGENWQTTDQFYPIPQNELDNNPNIRGHQNDGY
jgi:hypothetical protein